MQLFLQSIYNTRLHKIDQVADVSPLSCRFMAFNTARTPYDGLLSILACWTGRLLVLSLALPPHHAIGLTIRLKKI